MIKQNSLNTLILLSPFFLQEHSERQPGNAKLLLAIPNHTFVEMAVPVYNRKSVSSVAQLVVTGL